MLKTCDHVDTESRLFNTMNSNTEKKLAMFESVKQTASSISSILKDMPRTGKKGRNIFVKSYSRRPQNKKKKAMIMNKVALSACFGAMSLLRVIQTPIPKYPKGTT